MAADVLVDLLRPVADVGVHVRPERGILEPLLHPRLVGRDLGHALADADDEHDAARRGPSPPASKSPRRNSRRFARWFPSFRRIAEVTSFSAQVSPLVTSNPAAAILRRASTPAWYQVALLLATHFARSSGGSRPLHGTPARAPGSARPALGAAGSCRRRPAERRCSTARTGTPSRRASSPAGASRLGRRRRPGADGIAAPRAGGTCAARQLPPERIRPHRVERRHVPHLRAGRGGRSTEARGP